MQIFSYLREYLIIFPGKAFNESFTDTPGSRSHKTLHNVTKMSACTEHLLNWQKSAHCLSTSEQAEGRMRFPESLIQLKTSGALKGAFSLLWFYLLFPLTECRREFIPQQQKNSLQYQGPGNCQVDPQHFVGSIFHSLGTWTQAVNTNLCKWIRMMIAWWCI